MEYIYETREKYLLLATSVRLSIESSAINLLLQENLQDYRKLMSLLLEEFLYQSEKFKDEESLGLFGSRFGGFSRGEDRIEESDGGWSPNLLKYAEIKRLAALLSVKASS